MDFGFAHHLFFRHAFNPPAAFFREMMENLNDGSDDDDDYNSEVPDHEIFAQVRAPWDTYVHDVEFFSDDDDDEEDDDDDVEIVSSNLDPCSPR